MLKIMTEQNYINNWSAQRVHAGYADILCVSNQFSHSVMSQSLRPHGSQNARLPCPLVFPREQWLAEKTWEWIAWVQKCSATSFLCELVNCINPLCNFSLHWKNKIMSIHLHCDICHITAWNKKTKLCLYKVITISHILNQEEEKLIKVLHTQITMMTFINEFDKGKNNLFVIL